MVDSSLRLLERACPVQAEAAALRQRVRIGELSPKRLLLAARFGDLVARACCPELGEPDPLDAVRALLARLDREPQDLYRVHAMRVALATFEQIAPDLRWTHSALVAEALRYAHELLERSDFSRGEWGPRTNFLRRRLLTDRREDMTERYALATLLHGVVPHYTHIAWTSLTHLVRGWPDAVREYGAPGLARWLLYARHPLDSRRGSAMRVTIKVYSGTHEDIERAAAHAERAGHGDSVEVVAGADRFSYLGTLCTHEEELKRVTQSAAGDPALLLVFHTPWDDEPPRVPVSALNAHGQVRGVLRDEPVPSDPEQIEHWTLEGIANRTLALGLAEPCESAALLKGARALTGRALPELKAALKNGAPLLEVNFTQLGLAVRQERYAAFQAVLTLLDASERALKIELSEPKGGPRKALSREALERLLRDAP